MTDHPFNAPDGSVIGFSGDGVRDAVGTVSVADDETPEDEAADEQQEADDEAAALAADDEAEEPQK